MSDFLAISVDNFVVLHLLSAQRFGNFCGGSSVNERTRLRFVMLPGGSWWRDADDRATVLFGTWPSGAHEVCGVLRLVNYSGPKSQLLLRWISHARPNLIRSKKILLFLCFIVTFQGCTSYLAADVCVSLWSGFCHTPPPPPCVWQGVNYSSAHWLRGLLNGTRFTWFYHFSSAHLD